MFYREIIEVAIAPKSQKLSAADHAQLTELLLSKDAELKKTLELADEQAKIQEKMNELKAEVYNKVNKDFTFYSMLISKQLLFLSDIKLFFFQLNCISLKCDTLHYNSHTICMQVYYWNR